ncbi:MAG: hypothetical protein A2Z88_00170 [Omnitrophica WOR_2 bacterium GWA2_47_8]|nr:MAG: hypothetical protein A2Z88_00170 [Omnitrophica WOR_2 bacterium GWA2_47_8]
MYNFSILFILVFFLASCSSVPKKQPLLFNQATINALVAADDFQQAAQVFKEGQEMYGPKSKLLYLFDRAYVAHLNKEYKESIRYFTFAEYKIDELYTKSISNILSTWILNDINAPYRGEEFEHTLINIFQALNYLSLDDVSEALVEARSLDRKMNLLKQLHPDEKNVYREDAFGRLLAGILYESTNRRQDLNDAIISYKKALTAYESPFYQDMHPPPLILKENLKAAAEKFDRGIDEKQNMAEVYLIHSNGLGAIKYPVDISFPTPDGYLMQIAFPEYNERFYEIKDSQLAAVSVKNKKFQAKTELGVNLVAVAKKSFTAKKNWFIAKGIVRPLGKYALERTLEEKAREEHGRGAAYAVKGVSSLYNLFSEQADLRSWQTLPAEIRIGRLILPPGSYTLNVSFLGENNKILGTGSLGEVTLKEGEKRFFNVRSVH